MFLLLSRMRRFNAEGEWGRNFLQAKKKSDLPRNQILLATCLQ